MSRHRLRPEVKLAIDELRSQTHCKTCGKQPIEWHGEHHPKEPRLRISNMVDLGYRLEDVLAEVSRCEPLCRSCHMKEDGRTKALIDAASLANKGKSKVALRPCSQCGTLSLLRKGLCKRCYHRDYMRAYRKK